MIAWNGNEWSNPQIQNGLSSLSNPVTFDPILFLCQHASFRSDELFVVGCDEGNSKDIWFSSRSLGTIENSFPPPSAWVSPTTIISSKGEILSASYIANSQNKTHLVWTQSSLSGNGNAEPAIYYTRWNEKNWSRPVPIIINLQGSPSQLSLSANSDGRLFLTWVDQTNGGILFSWSSASRADIPLEWSEPSIIPIPEKLMSSPSILTDQVGNIVLTYAVPFNDDRGIYITRSSDFGGTWSQPMQVIDANASGWDFVDHPKLALSSDGTVSIEFLQYSLSNNIQPAGLYLSQSQDGGETWKPPMLVSDQMISWSEIFSFENQAIHLLWQENHDNEVAIYHQYSMDGGNIWSKPQTISSSTDTVVISTATIGVDGRLYFLQLTGKDLAKIHQWLWDGSRWLTQESAILSEYSQFTSPNVFLASITSDGSLSVISGLENTDESDMAVYELVSDYRHVDVDLTKQTNTITALPTLSSSTNILNVPSVEETPTTIVLPANFNDLPSNRGKNFLGIVFVIVVLVILFIVIRPSRKGK